MCIRDRLLFQLLHLRAGNKMATLDHLGDALVDFLFQMAVLSRQIVKFHVLCLSFLHKALGALFILPPALGAGQIL